MTIRNHFIISGVFLFFFFLLTPLGIFNDWIPPIFQTGFYSISIIDAGDDTGYYAYLRSAFFDGDWDFINEENYAHIEQFTPTGYVFNNWQIGQSILFLPFFLAGHLIALIYNNLGYPVSIDGYSVPYYMATAIASQTYLLAGLFLLFNILKKRFSGTIALISTLAIWLGSPLLYYTFIRQRMAHTSEFFLVVVFVYFWLKERKSEENFKHAIMGIILGWLCMVRLINVGLFVYYLSDQYLVLKKNYHGSKDSVIKTLLSRSFWFFGVYSLSFIPQFYTWYKINGMPLPSFHVSLIAQTMGDLTVHSFLEKLFNFFWGSDWGLMLSAPLLVVGILGFLVKNKLIKEIQFCTFAYLGFLIIVIISFAPSYSYGNRYLISAIPFLAFGLAAILEKCSYNRSSWMGALVFIGVCVFAQYFMIAQYKITLFYDDPEFTVKALVAIPSLIINQPHLLLRSTNFIRLIFLDQTQAWNYSDFLFLFVFPLAQLTSVCLLYFFFYWIKKNTTRCIKIPSRFLLGFGTIFSFSLVIVVHAVAPSKANQEIYARQQYTQIMKNADLALGENKNSRAIRLYLKAQNLIPELPIPNFKIGLSLDNEKKFIEANKYYKKVLKEHPNNPATLYNFGNNLLTLGQLKEAEKQLKIAISLTPGNKKFYNALAQVYTMKGALSTAKENFNIALMLDPKYGIAHANLAILLTKMNDPKKAIGHLKKAISLGVRNPLVFKLSKLYKIPEGRDDE